MSPQVLVCRVAARHVATLLAAKGFCLAMTAAFGAARCAAASAIRRVLHEGQTPRPLQKKATRKSSPQSSHRPRAKPWAKMPLPKRSVGTPGQEIEANRLACRKVNRHRRIEFEELRHYQAAQQQQLEQALQDLTKLSEELGLEL